MSTNPSLPLARAAAAELKQLGWDTKGRGWMTKPGDSLVFPSGRKMSGGIWGCAEVLATRGTETLLMVWADGECVQQTYSLWDANKTIRRNAIGDTVPNRKLTFDTSCSDQDLLRELRGMKVTWWNKLGQFEMTAVVDPIKVQIEHTYLGHGTENPEDRVIKFIDKSGGGFRAFRLGALMKVG